MIKIVLFFLISFNSWAQYSDAFKVDVYDRRITVSSPEKKVKVVSAIIINHTLDKIVSELRADNKVIKQFVLLPDKKEVIQVKMEGVKLLKYVPLAPPFDAAELKFNQRPYEIPEKKQEI